MAPRQRRQRGAVQQELARAAREEAHQLVIVHAAPAELVLVQLAVPVNVQLGEDLGGPQAKVRKVA